MAMVNIPNCENVDWDVEKRICDMASGASFMCSSVYCEGLTNSCVPTVCR